MKGMKGVKRVKRVKHVTAPAREASRCYRQYLPALISFLPRSCASSAGESFFLSAAPGARAPPSG